MIELKQTNKRLVFSVMILTALAAQPARSAVMAASLPGGPVQTVAADGASPRPPQAVTDDSGTILVLGRQVYADLQQARQAALNRQAGALRAALNSARENLAQLSLPPALMALKAQTQIVANNLADPTRPVDAGLWIPIDAELKAVSLYLAPENRAQAQVAAGAGRVAAAQGDRKLAGVQLNLLVSLLSHEVGAFPLQRVRADMQSAWSSASLPQPYWKGVLEAVQSALAEVHWVTGVNARPLLSAYTDATNAYVLWPQRKQSAIDYLGRAQQALSALPDGAGLAADAHRLMEKNNLGDADIKHLITAIGRRIDAERAAWREKLFDTFVATQVGWINERYRVSSKQSPAQVAGAGGNYPVGSPSPETVAAAVFC